MQNSAHVLFLLLLPASTVFAGNLNTQDKMPDQELEELLSFELEKLTKITVASKRAENIKDAPGIITVVTAEEIARYGYRNLRDILDRQTHLQVIGSNLFPHNRTTIRGVAFTHTDNNVLLLLNGRQFREPTSTSTNHDIYAAFPVESIKQIEIIRGPGSVLYGTNAFAGVINIITKDAPDTASGSLGFTYGSFDYKRGSLSGGVTRGDFEIFGAINGMAFDGDDIDNITDESGTAGTYKTGTEGYQMVLNAKYKGLTLNSLLSDTARDHHRSTFLFPSNEHEIERQFVDIGYRHDITENWDVSANFSYQHFRDFFFVNASATQLGDAENFFTELTTRAEVTDKLNFLAGGTINTLEGRFDLGSVDYDSSTISAYAQIDYQVLDWLKFIGGIQYNNPEAVSADWSPRLALITRFSDEWGAKLLYGKAFREASPVERFITAPTVIGNTSLNPETIDTIDVQLFYKGSNASAAITYFHSVQDDLVTRMGTIPQQLVNAGEVEYNGIELEGKWNIGHGFEFLGNMSYQTNENDADIDDVTFSSDWMVKTGLSYDSGRGYNLALFNSFFTASTLQNQDVESTVANVNPDNESYNLLTMNFSMNLGDFIQKQSFSNINIALYGDNLLNEDIFFPSLNRRTINSLPHHTGRGFFGTVTIDF